LGFQERHMAMMIVAVYDAFRHMGAAKKMRACGPGE
jgi:hypothetical protein